MLKNRKVPKNSKIRRLSTPIKIFVSLLILMSLMSIVYYWFDKNNDIRTSFNKDKYSESYLVRGVDLSHHNPIVDWKNINKDDIHFVYLKSTEGITHVDRNYPYNYRSAKENNLLVGTYHFYSFGVSGKEQAAHFIRTAKCQSGDMIPVIDVEHSPANLSSNNSSYIKLVVDELKVLENELYEHYGVHPIIYTNKACYKKYVKSNLVDNPIWICDLHNEPIGIDNWIIWQFSHKGVLEGVDGNIDLNYFRYSYDRLKEFTIP